MKIQNFYKYDSCIAFPWDAVINGGTALTGGLVSSLFNRHSQKEANKQNQRNFEAQMAQNRAQFDSAQSFNREQNHLSRLFATSERQAQEKFQREMIAQQNAYNSLPAQISRARSAGVNVNSLFGSSSNIASASPVGSPSGSSPSSLGSPSPVGVGGLPHIQPLSALFDARQAAEIANITADTQLKRSNRSLIEAQTVTEDALRAGHVAKQNVDIYWSLKDTNLKAAQIRNIDNATNKLDVEMDVLRQELDNAKQEYVLLQQQIDKGVIDSKYYERILRAELDKTLSDIGLTKQSIELIKQNVVESIITNGLLSFEYELEDATHSNLIEIAKNKTERSKFDTGKDLEEKELLYYTERGSGLARSIVSGLKSSSAVIRRSPFGLHRFGRSQR